MVMSLEPETGTRSNPTMPMAPRLVANMVLVLCCVIQD